MISVSAAHNLGLMKTAAAQYEQIIREGKFDQDIIINFVKLLCVQKKHAYGTQIIDKYLAPNVSQTALQEIILLYLEAPQHEACFENLNLKIQREDFNSLVQIASKRLEDNRNKNETIKYELLSKLEKRDYFLSKNEIVQLREFIQLDATNCRNVLKLLNQNHSISDCIFFQTRILHQEYNNENIYALVKLYLAAGNRQVSEIYLNDIDLTKPDPNFVRELFTLSYENKFYRFFLLIGKMLCNLEIVGKENLTLLIRIGFSLQKYNDVGFFIEKLSRLSSDDPDPYFYEGNLNKKIGKADEAIACYLKAIALDKNHFDSYFNLGNCYRSLGNDEQAIQAYKRAYTLRPEFASAKHLIDSLEGNQTNTAPKDYVENLFDSYASSFDLSLVGKLRYELPKIISIEIKKSGKGMTILDMGCGTGLLGYYLNDASYNLIGVDLSANMLTEASKRGCYAELHKLDVNDYLETTDHIFDIIVAADVFIYVGKLEQLFVSLKQKLSPGGLLIFSTENSVKSEFELLKSGRYAHSESYIKNLAKSHSLQIKKFEDCHIRNENSEKIMGKYCVLTKQ